MTIRPVPAGSAQPARLRGPHPPPGSPAGCVRSVPFFSSGLRLDADLHLPDDGGTAAPYPVVIPASGFQGLKVIHPERFARALTPLGYAVLAFDYRGFGASEGPPGRIIPQEWVEDVRAAVDRAHTLPEVDATRVALLGWGLGGGVVVSAAADDRRVAGVAILNGIGDGARSTQNMHDAGSWARLLARVEADRVLRVTLGRSENTSPWDIVRLDLDRSTDKYVEAELTKAPGFGSEVSLESADALLRFRPECVAHRIAPRPLLIVHGKVNRLHRPEEAASLHARAADPKYLVLLDGAGHTEWMFDDHPTFRHVIERVDAFLADTFAAGQDRLVGKIPGG